MLADPIAYEALTKGAVVVTEAGIRIGRVEHVLADSSLDLFDGIVVKTVDGLRFVAADQGPPRAKMATGPRIRMSTTVAPRPRSDTATTTPTG
jgi:hypothetical protein